EQANEFNRWFDARKMLAMDHGGMTHGRRTRPDLSGNRQDAQLRAGGRATERQPDDGQRPRPDPGGAARPAPLRPQQDRRLADARRRAVPALRAALRAAMAAR